MPTGIIELPQPQGEKDQKPKIRVREIIDNKMDPETERELLVQENAKLKAENARLRGLLDSEYCQKVAEELARLRAAMEGKPL